MTREAKLTAAGTCLESCPRVEYPAYPHHPDKGSLLDATRAGGLRVGQNEGDKHDDGMTRLYQRATPTCTRCFEGRHGHRRRAEKQEQVWVLKRSVRNRTAAIIPVPLIPRRSNAGAVRCEVYRCLLHGNWQGAGVTNRKDET